MNLSWNVHKRHRPLSHGYKIYAPYELTIIRTWYGRLHGHKWCEAWWWNQSISWFVRPVKSTPTAHGLDSTRSFLILFYAHLLYSLLRAYSIFSSTHIFYILFYAHLLYSLLRASSWFSLSAKSLIEPGLTSLKWSTRAQKLQTIHPVLWENYEVILSGTTVTLHTGCPQTNSGRHQLISIHIYTSSYVWRTAIVHSKNGNLTFVVWFGSSMNSLGCFRSWVMPINISLLSGWLVLNKHGFPKRKEVIPNDDVISLWDWGWGDPPCGLVASPRLPRCSVGIPSDVTVSVRRAHCIAQPPFASRHPILRTNDSPSMTPCHRW